MVRLECPQGQQKPERFKAQPGCEYRGRGVALEYFPVAIYLERGYVDNSSQMRLFHQGNRHVQAAQAKPLSQPHKYVGYRPAYRLSESHK